jgi:8-oxo-dGTP pyrophosphatase MutT (NUDIX family)
VRHYLTVESVRFEAFDPLAVVIRPAATLVVVKDAPLLEERRTGLIEPGQPQRSEVSVLLLQRSLTASFVPGAFVFAGGAIDPADTEMACRDPLAGPGGERPSYNTAALEERAAKVAALRECFEEAGLLPACLVNGASLGRIPEALRSQRRQVHGGEVSFAQALHEASVSPNWDAIVPFGRWVTPSGPPRRFDTRFFIVSAAVGQDASEDGNELIASRWMTPTGALAAADAGELLLIFPTRKTLERLRGATSLAQCLRSEGIVATSQSTSQSTAQSTSQSTPQSTLPSGS